MASDAKGSRSADHWQRKFYDSLDELEKKENEWNELESLLRKLAIRLSLAVVAQDKGLDKKLDKLRTALRDEYNPHRIKKIIDEVVVSLSKLQQTSVDNQATNNIAHHLKQLLDHLKIPDALQRQSRFVRKKLSKELTPKDTEAVIQDISDLIGMHIDQISSNKESQIPAQEPEVSQHNKEKLGAETKEKSASLLSNLFKGKAEDTVTHGEEHAVSQTVPGQEHEEESEVLPTEEAGLDDKALAADTLIRLLEKLSFPDDLHIEAELIRRRLEPCESQDQLAEGLDAVAEIVAIMHQRIQGEKKELEDFLRQLTERLHELDKDIQETVKIRQRSEKAGQEINTAVRGEVQEIEKHMQENLDLDALKTAVQSRVIIIRNHMDKFLQEEGSRHGESHQVVKRLSSQLEATQDEVEALRKQVIEAQQAAMRDQLTGIPNRLAYDQFMTEEQARFNRYGSAFSLMVWDVDKFKSVNDNYGHAAGDKVLTVIAQLLEKNIRETDRIARYGGEEFVIVLTETNLTQSVSLAEKLCQAIEKTAFHFRGTRVVITASCGIAEIKKGETAEDLFKRADAALYRAKENGRNRYETAD